MLRPNLSRKPFLDTRPVWLTGVALLLATLGLTALTTTEVLGVRAQEQEMSVRLAELQQHRDELVREVEDINRTLARVEWRRLGLEASALDQIVVQRLLVWSELLADLERLMPWDVRLVSIEPSVTERREVQITMRGVAAGRQSWLTLLERLFADPRFSDPIPASEETPSAGNPQGYRFQLRVRYWPEGQR